MYVTIRAAMCAGCSSRKLGQAIANQIGSGVAACFQTSCAQTFRDQTRRSLRTRCLLMLFTMLLWQPLCPVASGWQQPVSLASFRPVPALPASHRTPRSVNRHCIQRLPQASREIYRAAFAQPAVHGLASTAAASAPAKLAVFVSGGGSNFRAIHDSIVRGQMNAEITVSMGLRTYYQLSP